jgi:hypothetical protein
MRCTARVLIFHNVPYATFSLQRYQRLTRLLRCTTARSAGRAQDVDCCGAEALAASAFGENPGRGGAAGEFALPREKCAQKLGIRSPEKTAAGFSESGIGEITIA